MPQVFPRIANTISRLTLVGSLLGFLGSLVLMMELDRTPWVTNADIARVQPVQFSHRHHAGDDGIDCRYCHTSVETSSFAGIPPTRTCLNCHALLYANSQMLEPVRESFRSGRPIRWARVHDLPDFVYFNHSIHIHKGVGCSTCHGRVDRMPLVYQVASLRMEWCLSCHRHPERYLRPQHEIYNMEWEPGEHQQEEGQRLLRVYDVQSIAKLTDCYTCHR